MKRDICRSRASALLVTLGVLALLAIMGTTFVTMTRMNSRLNIHYVDGVQCEMLARGLLEYIRGILADDLDRSMKVLVDDPKRPRILHRYENRETSAPFIGNYNFSNMMVGMNTDDNRRNTDERYADTFIKGTKARWGLRLGIPPSNDFWIPMGYDARSLVNVWSGAMSVSWQHHGQTGSFYCSGNEVRRILGPLTWGSVIRVTRMPLVWDPERGTWAYDEHYATVTIDTGGAAYDVWVTMCQNGINDNPWQDNYTDPYAGQPGLNEEKAMWSTYYDTTNAFITPGGPSTYLHGPYFTGDEGLPGGRYWRTAVKIGMPEGMWWNINMVGNFEKNQTDYLNNMDKEIFGNNMTLKARMAKRPDMVTEYHPYPDMSNYGSEHLQVLYNAS